MVSATGARWTESDLIDNLANRHRHVPNNGYYKTHYLANNSSNFNQDVRIRILIDAGAQVLEHSNKDFAKAWLEASLRLLQTRVFNGRGQGRYTGKDWKWQYQRTIRAVF